jgi:hypothetical protein
MASAHTVINYKLSSSYPGGGEAWDPGAVLGDPNFAVLPLSKDGYLITWDATTKKIRVWRQNATTGALVEPTGVDLSTTPGTIQLLVLELA